MPAVRGFRCIHCNLQASVSHGEQDCRCEPDTEVDRIISEPSGATLPSFARLLAALLARSHLRPDLLAGGAGRRLMGAA